MTFIGELAQLTSDQLDEPHPMIMVPVGSTEQHGPHLPLDTDTRIAVAVTRGAAARLAAETPISPLVAPAVGYGSSGEHQSFPGTISIGTDALTRLLLEYGRSACCWARRVLFVNGHGGNTAALAAAVRRLRFEGRDVGWMPCVAPGGDAHAGHTETSLLLHLSPESVRVDRYRAGNRAPIADLLPAIRAGGVATVSDVGVLGDPTTATAVAGGRILAEMIADCTRAAGCWTPDDNGMLR